MQMYFDFTKDARRASIVDQLKEKLGESGWAAVSMDVAHAGVPKKHHHGIVEVRETIDNLKTTDPVKEHMHAIYEILAAAEAKVHGCEVDETHFHEVGNGEAIFNTLITCLAIEKLQCERLGGGNDTLRISRDKRLDRAVIRKAQRSVA